MKKKDIRQFYQALYDEVSAPGLTADFDALLDKDWWEEKLSGFLPVRSRFTCSQILEACRPGMDLLGTEPEEGWMSFTYRYVCHILYPEPEFTETSVPSPAAVYYLRVLRYFFDLERQHLAFDPMKDFAFLDDMEIQKSDTAAEYRRFLRFWREEFVYEMMRLSAEVTKFKTLEHIAGVHYVAMTIGRGLSLAEAPIDLALLSGAAAGHDLGKFGCKPNEKVPFMHYYYTALWYDSHNLPYIGHIAANHSTWDLEPENLSVEALALIYSDFRVKSSRGKDGVEIMHITPLADAFNTILGKFFDVDEKKVMRYRFVYSKLQDFETWMRANGVDVDLSGHPEKPVQMPLPALQTPAQAVQSLTFMAIEHNLSVMHRMMADRSFGNLLEAARSEKNWKNVRAYLNIFREYFTYANDIQKEQTLQFLYELFMNRDGEIRIQSAQLLGQVIAQFNAGYRKRRPEGMKDITQEKVKNLWTHYLQQTIRPDYRLVDLQQKRIRNQLKNIVMALTEYAEPGDLQMFLEPLLFWYRSPEEKSGEEQFVLMNCVEVLPFDAMSDEEKKTVADTVLFCAESGNAEVRISAWRALEQVSSGCGDNAGIKDRILAVVENADLGDSHMYEYLKCRIENNLGVCAKEEKLYDQDIVSEIFLDNLKTGTPWVAKAVNIQILEDQVARGDKSHALHIAAHLSNMLKVGHYMLVRNTAGKALLSLGPLLRVDQWNEIAVEMLRDLEIGETDYSRTIPEWLGQVALWLPPEQLDELLLSLSETMTGSSEYAAAAVIDAAGTMLEHYPVYRTRFKEDAETGKNRWKRLVGMLLAGMANYREIVRQEALLVMGQKVFGSKLLHIAEKRSVFNAACTKIFFQLKENPGGELTHFYRAACLSNLYRFITEYRLMVGEFDMHTRKKVAFFPGTFDPFTLSHKGIAKIIRDMGFDVYLSVDEFSWSKKAQPHFIRRRIVNMSTADEFHIHLFPYEIPLSPGNPDDMRRLQEIFADRELYLVVGSDVIANASFYKEGADNDVIRSMNHVAFRRVGDEKMDSKYNRDMMRQIRGKLVELELPEELMEISSTRIRENIDMNRDISNLIDPVVQEYIYNNGLYLREPEYKPLINARAVSFEEADPPYPSVEEELAGTLLKNEPHREAILQELHRSGDRLMILRNQMSENRPVAFARFQYLAPEELYGVLGDIRICDMIRSRTTGDVLLISGFYAGERPEIHDAEQLLLTELIMYSFGHRCDYAVFYPEGGVCSNRVASAMIRQGFVRPEEAPEHTYIYVVDMHAPLMLLANMETTLKEPFSSNTRILRTIHRAQQELQHSMAKLYPGQLVLSVSASVLYHRMVDKVVQINHVPREVQVPRKLGEMMCVPYGKILRGGVMPNTVTKTIHTDKVYDPDLIGCSVEAFPNYTPLPTQVKTIKSFGRPVILVDDVLNRSGIRISTLAPMFLREGVNIKKLLVGVMTGYGRDVLASLGLSGDSVYYVPNMRDWFAESSLYPFIGGDQVRRDQTKVAGLEPSINLIRPYTNVALEGVSDDAAYDFSACCIRNARDVLLVLEQEYRARFARNLTLSRLSEAIILPLCPDRGDCMEYDPNLAASVYLENDLQMLYRTRANTARSQSYYAERMPGGRRG